MRQSQRPSRPAEQKPLRVLHLSVWHKMGSGHRAQLSSEAVAAVRLGAQRVVFWDICALSADTSGNTHWERLLPRWARPLLLAKLYYWFFMLRCCRNYDFVLGRHVQSDPFSLLFAPFVPNLVTVHHSKEFEELSLREPVLRVKIAKMLEGSLKGVALRHLRAVAGVTGEIAEYESGRILGHPRPLVFPNGVDYSFIDAATDQRGPMRRHAVFVSSEFYPWQGLDLVVRSWTYAREQQHEGDSLPVLHVVGRLSANQLEQISSLRQSGHAVVHGVLDAEELRSVLGRMDVAIGSFALERKGLREASTLKVREYLAAGIPVYSGHRDVSLPASFQFYMFDEDGPSVERMIAFLEGLGETARSDIRDAAEPFITKESAMRGMVCQLSELDRSPACPWYA